MCVRLCVCAVSPALSEALDESFVERGILWDGLYDASVVGHMTDSPLRSEEHTSELQSR